MICSCKNNSEKEKNTHGVDAISVVSTYLKSAGERRNHLLQTQINLISFLKTQKNITHTGNQFSDEFSNSSGELTTNGFAELVDEAAIWDGALEEGAMLQYWNNTNNLDLSILKLAIKDQIQNIENPNFEGGHSVIFKSYLRNEFGHITGFNYYDYSGTNNTCIMGDLRLFLGANLIDVN